MGELSPWHWAVVILVLVLLFGARRLPDAARSLGRSARILKSELHAAGPETPSATPQAAPSAASSPPPSTPEAPEPTVTTSQTPPRQN